MDACMVLPQKAHYSAIKPKEKGCLSSCSEYLSVSCVTQYCQTNCCLHMNAYDMLV